MSEDTFFLFSNGSQSYYPSNTMSNFRTQLSEMKSYDRNEYEVNIKKFTYTNTIKLFGRDEDSLIGIILEDGKKITTHLSNKFYKDIYYLIKDMNLHISKLVTNGTLLSIFSLDRSAEKVVMNVIGIKSLILSGFLCDILGFGAPSAGFKHRQFDVAKYTASYTADLRAGKHLLMIYCDLVEPSNVDNKRLPLLEMVDISDSTGKQVTHSFDNKLHLNLRRSNFDCIHIWLADETGDYINFDYGTVAITLQVSPK
jgi:hypothetical protein